MAGKPKRPCWNMKREAERWGKKRYGPACVMSCGEVAAFAAGYELGRKAERKLQDYQSEHDAWAAADVFEEWTKDETTPRTAQEWP